VVEALRVTFLMQARRFAPLSLAQLRLMHEVLRLPLSLLHLPAGRRRAVAGRGVSFGWSCTAGAGATIG